MIAKRAARRSDGKSSFSKLAGYILADRGGGQSPEDPRATNCGVESMDTAVAVIEATQALNTRTRNDKTYHLIVSFPAGERPPAPTLAIIEQELCAAIGLGDHQRVSVVHPETGNPHFHVAINKIHPETLRAVEPYFDHNALGEACRELERRFGLTRVNHAAGPSRAGQPTRAQDARAHSGRQTFADWMRPHRVPLRQAVAAAPTWAAVHQVLAGFDLAIAPRAAGLAVSSRTVAATMKASAIGRELSMTALSRRLGEYQPPDPAAPPTAARVSPYSADPDPPVPGLWDQYKAERERSVAAKKPLLERERARRDAAVEALRASFAARGDRIRGDRLLSRRAKRAAYQTLAVERRAAYADARAACKLAVQAVHRELRTRTWQDWLIDRSLDGDPRALRALRARVRGSGTAAFGLSCAPGEDPHAVFRDLSPRVLRNGDVLYQIEGHQVRDTGGEIRIDSTSPRAIAAALEIARRKWDGPLSLAGGGAFQDAAAEAAGAARLPIAFADPVMERRRSLVSSLAASERAAREPLAAWVAARNAARSRTRDRAPMRLHRPGEGGLAIYRGVRRAGPGAVALLETPDALVALPISDRQFARFRRATIGTPVRYDSRGRCTFDRGRTI